MATEPWPTDPIERVRYCHETVGIATAALEQAVSEARAAGRSWVDIGTALGVSRQAATERFGRTPEPA